MFATLAGVRRAQQVQLTPAQITAHQHAYRGDNT